MSAGRKAKIKESARHRLVVEGIDDQWSIINLMARHGWDWDGAVPWYPYVNAAGSDDQVLSAIPVESKSRLRTGFVLDADLSASSRWAGVRQALNQAGYQVPSEPDPNGTILQLGDRRVGVWLMPNNQSPGKLEDFLAQLIPAGDLCWPWAQEATEAARTKHGAPFADKDRIKAEIHTWLAWREIPGQPFGTAITARAFAHDGELALAFVAWMKALFQDP